MKILVTGGLGFIGSHLCVELLNKNYSVVIIDNLSNSYENTLEKIKLLTNKSPTYYNLDLVSENNLVENIFQKHKFDYVIHLAGFKSVSESVKLHIKYYNNNINSTLNLIKNMLKYKCYNLLFSSSSTVYGIPSKLPITENENFKPTNPYIL